MIIVLRKKYYDIKPILDKGAKYSIIIGQRSNGKTYAALKYCLQRYREAGEQFVYLRRWDTDFKGARGQKVFGALVHNGEIDIATDGCFQGVTYYNGAFYFNKEEKGKIEKSVEPFGWAMSINNMEHDKSTSFPKVTTILFDEFLTRDYYLDDEFVKFMNVISTVKRDRDNVRIIMCGNTVNKFCPYFSEMGLSHIKEQKQGTIETYKYGNSGLSVAVEYCGDLRSKADKEASDAYFAFDNPRLQMITGGEWEIDIYPRNPRKFRPADIMFTYFIDFDGELIQGDIVSVDNTVYIFYHPKTTPLQSPDTDLVFSDKFDPRPNWRRFITRPILPIEKKIALLHQTDNIFYATNATGEIIRNYLIYCNKNKGA